MHNKLRKLNEDMTLFKAVTMINSIMLLILLAWSFAKPITGANTVNATSGNVATNLSINGNDSATKRAASDYEKARRRGYFTASEYAELVGISLETVYRHSNSGKIKGARLVDGRWRIPLCNE
jgi:excisionase family DNA binding protein